MKRRSTVLTALSFRHPLRCEGPITWPLKIGPVCCLETFVNQPQACAVQHSRQRSPTPPSMILLRLTLYGTYTKLASVRVVRARAYIYIYIYTHTHPAEAVGFLGRKNPQHAFLRRGSKAVGPMS